MNKIILIALLCVGTLSVNAQKIKWLGFEEAMELNKKNPKPILVDLYTDWCGWCKKMDVTTYKNKVIVAYINKNYYPVKLDGEGKKDITFNGKTYMYIQKNGAKYHELAVAILKGKMSYPSTAFFNSKKQFIQTVPGYLKTKQLEKILAYFSADAYTKTPWKDFSKDFKSKL